MLIYDGHDLGSVTRIAIAGKNISAVNLKRYLSHTCAALWIPMRANDPVGPVDRGCAKRLRSPENFRDMSRVSLLPTLKHSGLRLAVCDFHKDADQSVYCLNVKYGKTFGVHRSDKLFRVCRAISDSTQPVCA